MFKSIAVTLLCAGCVISVVGTARANAIQTAFLYHDLVVELDVPSHSAIITDQGKVTVAEGWNYFSLHQDAVISSFTVAGKPASIAGLSTAGDIGFPDSLKPEIPNIDSASSGTVFVFKSPVAGEVDFDLSFSATFFQDVSNTRFSRERVGGEITGTILDQGAYLSSAAYFYPQADEEVCSFRVTVGIPMGWNSVSDGNLGSFSMEGGLVTQTWENPLPADGVSIMAAPYIPLSQMVDGVMISCYFFEADTGLAAGYLEATIGYMQMYSDLIGPYPYNSFIVAENFFPTGYGMPGWTLLGQQVLRLPFIKSTSLGHEVLHNWWGNSVLVDYDKGNWCEALTVYGADYRYKLMSSPEAARSYRKDILKQYISYVNEGNDFPIREFITRSSPATRTIGYNKAMMVFHMIHEEIGDDPFFAAWKTVYQEYRGRKVSWENWLEEFQKISSVDLSHFLPEWIDRAGAPVLELGSAFKIAGASEAECVVNFDLGQSSDQDYTLRVPIRLSGPDLQMDTFVVLNDHHAAFSLNAPGSVTTIEVDPEYHIFRKLHPDEVEPIVSAVLGQGRAEFRPAGVDSEADEMFAQFGVNLVGSPSEGEAPDENIPVTPIILDPAVLPEYFSRLMVVNDTSINLGGVEYLRDGHTFIITGKNPGAEGGLYMVVLSGDHASLPRIGQLVPHYGKYSYLVFEGERNVGKGQWDITESQLRKVLMGE